MPNCNCRKDQTPADVFEYMKKRPGRAKQLAREEVGTGLFLVPDPESGILEEKVVVVGGITYDDCAKRGNNCIAYKWIPIGYKSEKEVRELIQGCSDNWCGPDQSWCPGVCFCGKGNFCR